MSKLTLQFVELVKKRSEENKNSISLLYAEGLIGNCISILRQELDTFIRIIYLGRISSIPERERLMQLTLDGQKWTTLTANNKWRRITDSDMVLISNQVKGYISYVYKFGCAFIHLSDSHDYLNQDPFTKLSFSEILDVKTYLSQYHGFPRNQELTIHSFQRLIPEVFKKISSNMLYYTDDLIEGNMIEF